MRMRSARFEDADDLLAYLLVPTPQVRSGGGVITMRAKKSGVRHTYRIKRAPKREEEMYPPLTWFVGLLVGEDNALSYQYLGMLIAQPVRRKGRGRKALLAAGEEEEHTLLFRLTAKSALGEGTAPVQGFRWLIELLTGTAEEARRLFSQVDIYRCVDCRRCGRLLTVPESVMLGLGPSCQRVEEYYAAKDRG